MANILDTAVFGYKQGTDRKVRVAEFVKPARLSQDWFNLAATLYGVEQFSVVVVSHNNQNRNFRVSTRFTDYEMSAQGKWVKTRETSRVDR